MRVYSLWEQGGVDVDIVDGIGKVHFVHQVHDVHSVHSVHFSGRLTRAFQRPAFDPLLGRSAAS